jgi:hypothetical protein
MGKIEVRCKEKKQNLWLVNNVLRESNILDFSITNEPLLFFKLGNWKKKCHLVNEASFVNIGRNKSSNNNDRI